MDISKIIRDARLKKGLSQEQVAKSIGVSRNAVTNWESNTSAPRRETALALAKLLDIPLGSLVPIHTYALDVVDVDQKGYNIDTLNEEDLRQYFSNKTNNNIKILKTWVSVDEHLSKQSVGVIVQDTSMSPVIHPGDTLIFQKDLAPNNGDVILCFHKDLDTYYIRSYHERGRDQSGELFYDIVAHDPGTATILCTCKNCSIIGIAVEHRRKMRR